MLRALLLLGLSSVARAVEKDGDDPLQWLRDSIPGEPGLDYPIFSAVEETAFSCAGKVFGGYYADPELGCQAYHVCLLDPLGGSMYPASFLCPNGTLFQQQIFNCDWWYNVDCAAAEGLYGLAEGAFGSSSEGGQCPSVSPQSDCGPAASNCWSPGQPDTDCPNFGLCCFDGCANTCLDGPAQSSQASAAVVTTPRPPTSTTGYDYPVPEVTLPVRPASTTEPSTLYGAPPPASRREQRGGRRRAGRKVVKRRRL